jgi:hypothetical protein
LGAFDETKAPFFKIIRDMRLITKQVSFFVLIIIVGLITWLARVVGRSVMKKSDITFEDAAEVPNNSIRLMDKRLWLKTGRLFNV